jgi:hypothetical protein
VTPRNGERQRDPSATTPKVTFRPARVPWTWGARREHPTWHRSKEKANNLTKQEKGRGKKTPTINRTTGGQWWKNGFYDDFY